MPDGATMSLPTREEVLGALGVDRYDDAPWDATADPDLNFRNHVEGWDEAWPPDCSNGWQTISENAGGAHNLHNGVHMWVGGLWQDDTGAMRGGTMRYNTGPYDPVFFLHHANIDRLWAEWQARHDIPCRYGRLHTDEHDVAPVRPHDRVARFHARTRIPIRHDGPVRFHTRDARPFDSDHQVDGDWRFENHPYRVRRWSGLSVTLMSDLWSCNI